MRRPQSTLAILGILFGGLLLACVLSTVLGLVWFGLFGTITGGAAPTPTP